MRKIRRIYESTQKLNFISPHEEFSLYWTSFQQSELDMIYQAIHQRELTKSLKIRDKREGSDPIFVPQGMLSLMFLKSYVGCSGRKLISYLNGNIDFQMFWSIFLGPERIGNFKIVSDIRCELSKFLDVKVLQGVLVGYWKLYLKETNIMLEDATCYETSMRYPTNVKLLWEGTEWSFKQLKLICKCLKIRMPRNKYEEPWNKYNN